MKWCRQYEGPYLVIETPSSVTAEIQRTAKMTAKTVHIDKLKAYLGTSPRSWLPATTGDGNTTVDPALATSPIPPDMLIGPIMPPSTGQQTVPRLVNNQQNGAGKQRDLSEGLPSSALSTSLERVEESERCIPNASSIQWETVRIPVEIVESKGSKPDNSSVQWNADLVPVSSESGEPGNSSIQWSDDLTPVSRETEETGDSSVQCNADLTPVKEGVIADVPAFDHVTASATVVRDKGESEETAGRPLPVPTEVHATPAGKSGREKRDVAGKSWSRSRAHTSAARQRGNKGRKSSGTITADIHPVYDSNKPVHVMSYSQLPPGDDVPSGSVIDQPANIDFSLEPSPERPSFELNPVADEFVPASTDSDRQREEVYSADWRARESRPQRNRKLPKKFANFHMEK